MPLPDTRLFALSCAGLLLGLFSGCATSVPQDADPAPPANRVEGAVSSTDATPADAPALGQGVSGKSGAAAPFYLLQRVEGAVTRGIILHAPHAVWHQHSDYLLLVNESLRYRWEALARAYESDAGVPEGARGTSVALVAFLLPDGSIDRVDIEDYNCPEAFALLGRDAVLSSGPYPAWPEAMRAELGQEAVLLVELLYR